MHVARSASFVAFALILLSAGCGRQTEKHATEAQAEVDEAELQQALDDVLSKTFEKRRLSLKTHAAWQILHGALAYQRDFLVETADGRLVSAVDHILQGGQMKGWTVERGIPLEKDVERFGLRVLLEEGSKSGQGHADQWLAVLAQCELKPEQEIFVDDQKYSMQDLLRQVQWDIPRNVMREFSWTLIGLTTYLPTDATWQASDGKDWSIEDLVRIEAGEDLAESACGGTHRLIGMTMALNHHRDKGGTIGGGWKLAEQRIEHAIVRAKELQNPDGSFSTHYFARGGSSADLAQNLGTTGHVLEFLAIALPVEQLREPWVQRAAWSLCDLFQKTMDLSLECGALYHAAHGLVLYRERVFGARRYSTSRPKLAP